MVFGCLKKLFSHSLLASLFLIVDIGYSQTPINGPTTLPPNYDSVPAYPVPVPSANIGYCATPFTWFWCRESKTLELKLEKKFWALVQNSDWFKMGWWIMDVENYINGSGTSHDGRLTMLQAFGKVMYFQGNLIGNWDFISLISAKSLADEAVQRLPNSPNALSIQSFLGAFLEYGSAHLANGNQILYDLDANTDQYGLYGSEGHVVASFGFMSITDPAQVQIGIDMLQDCTTAECLRTTSLAPYKRVGALIALAEGAVAIGDETKAHDLLDEAIDWASARNYPQEFLDRIEDARTTLMGPGGLNQQWQTTSPFGFVRMPLAPSQKVTACATCHIGAVVPQTQYDYIEQ
ncbi:MAG: hypothetical protein ACOH5I_06475 [Oligoflexus sp.]